MGTGEKRKDRNTSCVDKTTMKVYGAGGNRKNFFYRQNVNKRGWKRGWVNKEEIERTKENSVSWYFERVKENLGDC